MAIDVQVLDAQLKRAMRTLPTFMHHNAMVAMRQGLSKFRARFLASSPVKMRAMRRMWFWDVRAATSGRATDVVGEFYTPSRAAELLEKGGTVRPKSSAYLAIPIGHALTAGGRRKKGFKRAAGVVSRLGERAVVLRGKTGLLIFERRGDRLLPLFALVRQVKQPAILGLRKAWESHGVDEMQKRLQRAVETTIAGKKLAATLRDGRGRANRYATRRDRVSRIGI
jgi:hypothetical protein